MTLRTMYCLIFSLINLQHASANYYKVITGIYFVPSLLKIGDIMTRCIVWRCTV